MITINGVDLEFDMFDVNTADVFERECVKIGKDAKTVDGGLAANIRYQCELIFSFFDAVFGDGTSDAVFHGKMNLADCMNAFKSVIDESRRQSNAYNNLVTKYIPKNGKSTRK